MRAARPWRGRTLTGLAAATILICCQDSTGPDPVAAVLVSPASASVIVGRTTQFAASVADASGKPLLGRSVTWSTSNSTIAQVNGTGLASAVAVGGPVMIEATSEGKTGTATVTVLPVPVASVTVTPPATTLTVGQTAQLLATPVDGGGVPLTGRVITWTSANSAVADVDGAGLVTAKTVGGPVTITASSEGKTGSATVTVSPVPVASIAVSPANSTLTVGQTAQLTATPKDAHGDPLTGRVITWTSDIATVAAVDGGGLVTAKAAGGPATIIATSEGKTASAVVTVLPVAVVSVTVTPATTGLMLGQTVQLTATPKDGSGTALTGRVVTWASDNPSIADVDANGMVTTKAVGGPVTITATSEGKSGTASVTVIPVPVASVTVSPSTATVVMGMTLQLAATPRAANGDPLTGRTITWSSGNTTIADVDGTGLVTAKALGGPVTITALSEGHAGTASITVTAFAGPLHVSAVNPRYFTDGTGRAIYLTGSHTWPNFQNVGTTDPPAAFNWTGYLDFLVQHHHNVMKLWRWEQAKWSAETPTVIWIDPMPYLRTGTDTAHDGKPKFDLDQFNPAYFARMRQRVIEAGQRGIYVSIMLFDGWSIEQKGLSFNNPWLGHPLNGANNINGIDGGQNDGLETQTLHIPAITARQEAYVQHVIDAVNDLDNVLYEISNESTGGTEEVAWQRYMIQFIHQYETTKPKRHPVGMTALWPNGNNADLFASSADWIAPNGDLADVPAADGTKVILNDTDHLCGICLSEAWVWKSLTRGVNPMLMDMFDGAYAPTANNFNPNDPLWEPVRTNLGYARTYANRMNLIAMVPDGELASTGYCLANPTGPHAEYLVYLPVGGTITLNLSGSSGTFVVEWFNPGTGQTTIEDTPVTGGITQSFTPPFSGDAVLYLHQ